MWTHVSLHNISNLWVEMVKLGVSFHCIILFTVWVDCASVLHYLQYLTSAKFIMNLCLTWCCEPRLDVWFCVGWQCLDWLCVNSQWTQQAFMVHKCMTIKKWMCFTFTTLIIDTWIPLFSVGFEPQCVFSSGTGRPSRSGMRPFSWLQTTHYCMKWSPRYIINYIL